MDLLAIPFMRHVLFAGVLVALGLAPLSVYVALRRIVFVGAAVAEISSAGEALAVLLQYEPFAVALVLTVLTFLVLSRVADSPRLPLAMCQADIATELHSTFP
jgi:ABC-type Mn2+/Zn2+ transport system permease subunit